MAKRSKKYSIRFDEHGQILIDDPKLVKRLMSVLDRTNQLIVQIDSDLDPVGGSQILNRCPIPRPAPPPNFLCDPCDLFVRATRISGVQIDRPRHER